MEELIDILDENQKVIGQTSRKQAHKSGVWHRAVHGYLVNSKGEVVMQRRSKNKDLFPEYWDGSFAGHVDAGEATVVTAIRECKEELGIELKEEDLEYLFTAVDTMEWAGLRNNEFVDVYLCRMEFDNFKTQKEEVAEIKVVPIGDFIKMVERRDKNLFPHYSVFEKLVPVLQSLIK